MIHPLFQDKCASLDDMALLDIVCKFGGFVFTLDFVSSEGISYVNADSRVKRDGSVVRAVAALAEELSTVPSTHVVLRTTCDSSSKNPMSSPGLCGH